MDVADQSQEIRLFINQEGLIAALKDMANPFVTLVETLGVGLLYHLHEL